MDQRTTSLWIGSARVPRYDAPEGEFRADVAILGAGITGLTAALLLAGTGRKVVVLERNTIGSGETGNTTAHVTAAVDSRYAYLQRRYGRENARLVADGSSAAMEKIAQLIETHGIDCHFRRVPGYLFTERRNAVAEVKKEAVAAKEAGLDTEWVEEVPLPFDTRGAALFRDQAQFHPVEYLAGLAAAAAGKGVTIFEQAMVRNIERGEPNVLEIEGGARVLAADVLQATNSPVFGFTAVYTKASPWRTYAVAFDAEGDSFEGLFWDTEDPYHYIRWQETDERRFLIVGGEDHRVGHGPENAGEPFEKLIAWTRDRFGDRRERYRWSGQIMEPHGGIPLIGGSHGMYVSTGYSGQGMTWGTLGAMIASDAIAGVANRWAEIFAYDRVLPHVATLDYVKENLPFPKHFLADRLTSHDVEGETLGAVGRGEGKIIETRGRKVAVFRDDAGEVHTLSPVCTHMKCDVAWNAAEKSWDCPCHGSRFRGDGAVLNGPAHEPLQRIALEGKDASEEEEKWRRERDSNPR